MNLDLDEVTWEKYRCESCGRRFLSMAKRPRCPSCSSEEVTRA
ncbi:MAG TPA: hypothetical protein VMT31_07110 [Methanomicrobiales archaeon]|jgi:DNA-directed RNA polymerase subunit RPC12/RpoP|nr:hypothetical protein [Methanomicrobiales archaeon]